MSIEIFGEEIDENVVFEINKEQLYKELEKEKEDEDLLKKDSKEIVKKLKVDEIEQMDRIHKLTEIAKKKAVKAITRVDDIANSPSHSGGIKSKQNVNSFTFSDSHDSDPFDFQPRKRIQNISEIDSDDCEQ